MVLVERRNHVVFCEVVLLCLLAVCDHLDRKGVTFAELDEDGV